MRIFRGKLCDIVSVLVLHWFVIIALICKATPICNRYVLICNNSVPLLVITWSALICNNKSSAICDECGLICNYNETHWASNCQKWVVGIQVALFSSSFCENLVTWLGYNVELSLQLSLQYLNIIFQKQ